MTQAQWVVDASALLAAIHNEPGGTYVQQSIDHCVISAVNWSEVLQKLDKSGVEVNKIDTSLKALGLTVTNFTEEDAHLSASLWATCKVLGLSLADRACLATAIRLRTKVITADHAWKKLEIDIQIHLIR
ncbi:hypothetical protein MNBD_GAMMA26-1434 [hydrothermal vent metagenome]|uniref:PIN domain-containing protein n=1 Tax=hydrothermal vent metagenome TaxID=652676 RepID=A0A3B1B6Y9_9ZZZZ